MLSLNIHKTKFVAFSLSPRSSPAFQSLIMHDTHCQPGNKTCNCTRTVDRQHSIKYLGVILDENLNWKEHVRCVTNKIRKLIFKFYELRHILTLGTLKSFYFAFVESIINYGIAVWGNAGTTIMHKLQIAQKWVIKVMLFKNKSYLTKLVYKESELFTPYQLYIRSIIRFMLKFSYYKENVTHGLNTRFASVNNVLVQIISKHNVCQNHIYCVGPKMYNMLPLNIRLQPYHKVKGEICKWVSDNIIV